MEIKGKIDWGQKPNKKVDNEEEFANAVKKYEIFFTNGTTTIIQADNDYTESAFNCDAPILRFYNGIPEDQKIVAIFNLNNIAGYRAINDYINDEYRLQ